MSWQLNSDGGSVITGYRLYQTNVTTGGEHLVYDGSSIPTVTSFMATGLTSGHRYQFRASAINRVEEGTKSPLSDVIIAATVPTRPEAPSFVSATSTSITI